MNTGRPSIRCATSPRFLIQLMGENRFNEAEHHALNILKTEPGNFHARFAAGTGAIRAGRYPQGISHLRYALELANHKSPDITPMVKLQAVLTLGQGLVESGQTKLAGDSIIKYLRRFGLLAVFANDMGNLLARCERFEAAAECFRHAIESGCDHQKAMNNLGNVLVMAGHGEDAIKQYIATMRENGGTADTLSNLAVAYDSCGDSEMAGKYHQRALESEPENPEFNVNYASHLLQAGRIADALHYFLYRFQLPAWNAELNVLKQVNSPSKEDHFSNGTAVVGEQGLGDEIYLLQLLATLKRPQNWSYVGDQRLQKLFSRSFPEGHFLSRSAASVNEVVSQTPNVWRLDHVLLHASLSHQTSRCGWLTTDKESREHWRHELHEIDDKPKIGLSWTGGLRYSDRLRREIRPALWEALAHCGDYTFVDLQYDDRPEEREQISQALGLEVYRLPGFDLLGCLDHSTALLDTLDQIVTVDNSTAHIAGSLGVSTTVLLSHVADWRWGSSGKSSSTYPAITLMRQSDSGNWTSVLGALSNALQSRKTT